MRPIEIKEKFPILYTTIIMLSQKESNRTVKEIENRDLVNLFTWDVTTEGWEFWNSVSLRKYEYAKIYFPQYFELKEDKNAILVKTKLY